MIQALKFVYFPTDTDLYDAMLSNHRKVTKGYLIGAFQDRKILLSEENDREYLIQYLSSQNLNYIQFEEFSAFIARVARNDKTSSEFLKGKITFDQIEKFTSILERDNVISVDRLEKTKIDDNTMRISIDYKDIDYSRTPLNQCQERQGYIDLIKSDDGMKIRYSSNTKIEQIKAQVLKIVDAELPQTQVNKISFSGVDKKNCVTKFFTDFIAQLEGLTLETVSSIRLNCSKNSSSDMEDGLLGEKDEETDGFIVRARFDGSSLLSSRAYQQLVAKDYYITSICWISIENIKNPMKIEMEAQFKNTEDCDDFVYNVKGSYNYKNEDYTLLRPMRDSEMAPYLLKIEKAAQKAFDSLMIV